jgi:hypothetical protein
MNGAAPDLKWSASLTVTSSASRLPGDKIVLPQSALEQLLAAAPLVEVPDPNSRQNGPLTASFDPFNPHTFDAERRARQQFAGANVQPQLPHPLTFRLVNPDNGNVVYAGIREFSAEEGTIVMSEAVKLGLGIVTGKEMEHDGESRVTVHAQQLPKGTYVKLRPLEAGYDADDWKALLEQHLRANFTTLTKGTILIVPGGGRSGSEAFRLLVDEFKPEGDGVCIVDTDLEVDIEALNEEQARETMKQLAERNIRAPGTQNGSSAGGKIEFGQEGIGGQVLDGEYVDYEVPAWDRSRSLEIKLHAVDDERELDLLVKPFGSRHRTSPREDDYMFASTEGPYPRTITIQSTNSEMETAESIRISVYSFPDPDSANFTPVRFTISITPSDSSTSVAVAAEIHGADEVQCKNCKQWVPQRTLMLHENFCYRNNILCPKGCDQVFQKNSPEWKSHWHCELDSSFGNSTVSKLHHDAHHHEPKPSCSACSTTQTFAGLDALAYHRTTTCPGRLILCRFCHLQVPQEGDPEDPHSPEMMEATLLGMTPHELADGARTTECDICGKFVRLRDMESHRKYHDMDKKRRPTPRLCRNTECGRTRDGATKNGETRPKSNKDMIGDGSDRMGLCSRCFGPLYVATHDPEGKALRRRIERRLLTQLVTGCGKAWCRNDNCKTGRANLGLPSLAGSIREALPVVQPALKELDAGGEVSFCVDDEGHQTKELADKIAMTGVWNLEWCAAAAEAVGGGGGHEREVLDWLDKFAPKKAELQ